MKRIIAVLLVCALLTGCSSTAVPPVESTQPDPEQPVQAESLVLDETVPEFTGMADAELLPYLEQAIYTDPVNEWEVYTKDHMPSAQWEIMVLVTEEGHEVLCW